MDKTVSIQDPSKAKSWQMFDRIADTYDPLNRTLSLRQDVAWRKKLATFLPPGEELALLDLATGTGDIVISLCQKSERIQEAVGMDLAENMLEIGREKLKRQGLDTKASLHQGDATAIPVEDESYDVTTIAFGIRNVDNVPKSLEEMYRVLKPGGRSLILEFALPKNALMRWGYLFYFRHVLPRVGGLVSGDREAYNYLNQSVEAFPYGNAFCDLMREAGFQNVKATPLTFGIAMIYQGDKLDNAA